MKNFNEKCYEILRKVPKGRVTTYKEIARALKSKAYRAVGNAMNKNPYAPEVPCHRVVKSNGEVGGFAERLHEKQGNPSRVRSGASGVKNKIKLLKSEGIEIINNKIDLDKYLFKF